MGKAFKGLNINDEFYILDGNGGGEKTEVNSTYTMIIASNGFKAKNCKVSKGTCKIDEINNELVKLQIDSPVNESVDWKIIFFK